MSKNLVPSIAAKDGTKFHVVDGLIVAQGPNYALAKRLQHWRAIVARSQGCIVSSNVAPSTSTASVVSNKNFARAYNGMPFFKPFEIFQQDTSNAVMSSLLLFDLNSPNSAARPEKSLRNPLELFTSSSFHGGVWRAGYKMDSLGEVSVIVHFAKVAKPILLLLLVLVVVLLVFLRK